MGWTIGQAVVGVAAIGIVALFWYFVAKNNRVVEKAEGALVDGTTKTVDTTVLEQKKKANEVIRENEEKSAKVLQEAYDKLKEVTDTVQKKKAEEARGANKEAMHADPAAVAVSSPLASTSGTKSGTSMSAASIAANPHTTFPSLAELRQGRKAHKASEVSAAPTSAAPAPVSTP